MPRDLRRTEEQAAFFELIGDMHNPTAAMFSELFARHKDPKDPTKTTEPRYYVDDIIEIGPDQCSLVKPNSATTVGIFIVNKFLIEPLQVLGYVNKTFDNKVWGEVESKVAEALLNKDISTTTVHEFIDRTQFLLGGPFAHIINPSINYAITNLPPSAAALKKKLLAENKEAIKANDPQVASEIERAVTNEAYRVMKESNDPSLGFFNSGTIDVNNNYKTMFVMKGAVKDNTGSSPTGFKVITSEYNNGVSKEDLWKIADTPVTSYYSSGVATQDSGYMGKKYNNVYQRVRLMKKGSDCGTKETVNTMITSRHLYRYIIEGGKPVCLTPEVLEKYKGKMCKLRSPLHCKAKDPTYCNVCMGDRLYNIGIHNVGLTISNMSGATLNASLRAKHDATVKYSKISLDDILKYVK